MQRQDASTAIQALLLLLLVGCGAGSREGTPEYAVRQLSEGLKAENMLAIETYLDPKATDLTEAPFILLLGTATKISRSELVENMAEVSATIHDDLLDHSAELIIRLRKTQDHWQVIGVRNAAEVADSAKIIVAQRLEQLNDLMRERISSSVELGTLDIASSERECNRNSYPLVLCDISFSYSVPVMNRGRLPMTALEIHGAQKGKQRPLRLQVTDTILPGQTGLAQFQVDRQTTFNADVINAPWEEEAKHEKNSTVLSVVSIHFGESDVVREYASWLPYARLQGGGEDDLTAALQLLEEAQRANRPIRPVW